MSDILDEGRYAWARVPPTERSNPDCETCGYFGVCMYHDIYGRDGKTKGNRGESTMTKTETKTEWEPTTETYAKIDEPVRAIVLRHWESTQDTRRLVRLPLPTIAPNAILVIARHGTHVADALDVVRFWSFTPKGEIVVRHAHAGPDDSHFSICTIATRGRVTPRDKSIRLSDVAIVEDLHAWIETVTDGPLVELFAWNPRPGWYTFGQIGSVFTPKEGDATAGTPENDAPTTAPKLDKEYLRILHGDPTLRARLIKKAYADGILRQADNLKDPWKALVEAVPSLTTGASSRWFDGAVQAIGLLAMRNSAGEISSVAHVPAFDKTEREADMKEFEEALERGGGTIRVEVPIRKGQTLGEAIMERVAAASEPEPEPDPFDVDEEDPEPQATVLIEAGGFTETQKEAMIRSAEIQGLIPTMTVSGDSLAEAWIKLQYAAPAGWFDRWRNAPPQVPSAQKPSTGCAACDRGEKITDETAHKHVCEDRSTTPTTQAPKEKGPGRPTGRTGKCSICGSPSHNARTCGRANAQDASTAPTKPKNGTSTDPWAQCIAHVESSRDEDVTEETGEALMAAFRGAL